jgi:hypothetical protein
MLRYDKSRDHLDYLARVSGCVLAVSSDPEAERYHQQNIGMKLLYDSGCRRIVAPKLLPRTGDGEVYLLRGKFV